MNPNETTAHPIAPADTDADRRAVEDELRRQWLAGRPVDGAAPPPADAPTGGNPYYAAPPPYTPPPGRPPTRLERMKSKGGLLGWIGSLLLLLFKIGGPVLAVAGKLKFLVLGSKLLLTGGSMLVSMWAWGLLYGPAFGVGLVVLIFIHECGHALAARRLGIPVGMMVFVPLMGAFVTTKRGAKDIVQDAFIGIMGPVFGALAGVGCLALFWLLPSHSSYWLALAQMSFLLNLFNLLPVLPLDGGWIAPLFSRKLRAEATAADRWRYGAAYLGLVAFLALGCYGLYTHLVTLPRPVV